MEEGDKLQEGKITGSLSESLKESFIIYLLKLYIIHINLYIYSLNEIFPSGLTMLPQEP